MSNVSFTIGDYEFDPVPANFNISSEVVRTNSGKAINKRKTASIEGALVVSSKQTGIGIATAADLQIEMERCLLSCSGCQRMVLACEDEVFIDAYVKVNSLNFEPSQNNWVYTVNYNLQLEWNASEDNLFSGYSTDSSGVPLISGSGCAYDDSCYSCLSSVTETWDISQPSYEWEFCGESGNDQFTITHNLSAQGFDCCISGVETQGWEAARDWVTARLGPTPSGGTPGENVPDGIAIGFDPADYIYCDIKRSQNLDKCGGSFSVNETFTAIHPSGLGCVETFTVERSTSIQNSLINYTIQGTITGMEKRNANFDITTYKVDAAKACWNDVSGELVNRLNCAFEPVCPINSRPVSSSLGINPAEGTLNYSYQFYDKPALFNSPLIENISIQDTLPALTVNEIQVPGRQAGPILHSCGTTNAQVRSVTITAIFDKSCITDCSGVYNLEESGVHNALCCLEQDLRNNYDVVLLTQNSRNWDPFSGSYSRQVAWTYQSCSGTLPTTFC